MIPDPTLDVSQYLFHHDGIDFIWTTGGPKAVAAANQAGKPCLSVGAGNAPVYIHRSADVRMAVVDMLISKTFDSSVICPAEQTCVIDDAIWDETVAELERMGARLLARTRSSASPSSRFAPDGRVEMRALGQSCVNLGEMAGFEAAERDKVLLAPLPSDLEELARHPLIQEKLMPVLGLVRSPSVEHALDVCELVTEHGGLGHTSAVYATDQEVVDRFARAIRTGRILVNAPTAVGALGGVYNSMTPTFSLGCGTWGGSVTTDNVNYRNLLNVKTVSRRQAPPQWFRVPSDTYFNPGAIDSLRELRARPGDARDRPRRRGARRRRRGAPPPRRRRRARLLRRRARARRGADPRRREGARRAAARPADRRRRRLGDRRGEGHAPVPREPGAVARRADAALPRRPQARGPLPGDRALGAARRGAHHGGTGSEVSPAAVLTVDGRKATLVDYSLVPDMAVVEPRLTLSMPPTLTADTGIDALTHALEAAVSIFASPYTDAFCVQAVYQILPNLPRAFEDGSDLEARTAMSNAATIAGLAFSNAFVGVNHALAHAVGARFGIAHGRANAIFLPHVLRYNASLPTKFMPAPGYTAYVAPGEVRPDRLDHRARRQDRGAAPERLFAKVEELLDLARAAFEDPSIRTNPASRW